MPTNKFKGFKNEVHDAFDNKNPDSSRVLQEDQFESHL